jgi:transcription initiation factor IIE alpha subunit
MADKEWETDEDEMIYHLQVHKNLIGWTMDKLKEAGIPCERTKGRDANGDILYYRAEDELRVKQIVREINAKYNQS